MTDNRPKHIQVERWETHKNWMKVLSEGQLTNDPVLKMKRNLKRRGKEG